MNGPDWTGSAGTIPSPHTIEAAPPTGILHPINTLWHLYNELGNASANARENRSAAPPLMGLGPAVETGLEGLGGALQTAFVPGQRLVGMHHVAEAANQAAAGTARALTPFAVASAIDSPVSLLPLLVGTGAGEVVGRGLHHFGVPSDFADLGGTLAGLGSGSVVGGLLPGEPGGEPSPRVLARGERKLLRALRPPANTEGAELRPTVHEAVPELRKIAQTRPLRKVPMEDRARTAAEAITQGARNIEQNEHEPIIARLENKPVNMEAVGRAALGRINPQEVRENPAATQAALQFAKRSGEPATMRGADAFRRILRRELPNEFGRLQGPEIEARKGAVNELVNQLEQTAAAHGEPSLRDINQRFGRLYRIGDRLKARAPAAEAEPGLGGQIEREGHIFMGAHRGTPYLGLFGRPLGLLRAAFFPTTTNELVSSAMKDFARGPARRSLVGLIRARRGEAGIEAAPLSLPSGQYEAGPSNLRPQLALPGPQFEIVGERPLQTPTRPTRPVRGLLMEENPPHGVVLPRGVIGESGLDLRDVLPPPRPGERVRTSSEARRLITAPKRDIPREFPLAEPTARSKSRLAPATHPEAWLNRLVEDELDLLHKKR